MRKISARPVYELKRTPINFLSLFRYKSNKTRNHIKHVKLKEKVLLLAHENYKPDGYLYMHNKNLIIKHQLENVKF